MGDPLFTLQGKIETLEIARGHDGFLRGDPEPVVIFAAYLAGTVPQVIGRTLHRFRAHSPFPSHASADRRVLPACGVHLPARSQPRWVMLAVALEEDGGEDVQRIFGALERHATVSVWAPEASDPDPVPVTSIPVQADWFLPRPVEVLLEGAHAGRSCQSDKWVGAVCWAMTGAPSPALVRYRLPFLAEDRRNDWTAVIDVAR
jgi:hypothetical protein